MSRTWLTLALRGISCAMVRKSCEKKRRRVRRGSSDSISWRVCRGTVVPYPLMLQVGLLELFPESLLAALQIRFEASSQSAPPAHHLLGPVLPGDLFGRMFAGSRRLLFRLGQTLQGFVLHFVQIRFYPQPIEVSSATSVISAA